MSSPSSPGNPSPSGVRGGDPCFVQRSAAAGLILVASSQGSGEPCSSQGTLGCRLPEALRAVLPYGGKVELGEIRRRIEGTDARWSTMFTPTKQRTGEKGLLPLDFGGCRIPPPTGGAAEMKPSASSSQVPFPPEKGGASARVANICGNVVVTAVITSSFTNGHAPGAPTGRLYPHTCWVLPRTPAPRSSELNLSSMPTPVRRLSALTTRNEYYKYGQGRQVDHWSLPFRSPIEVHTESWQEVENRIPKDLFNEADPRRDWKDIDELFFRFGRVPAAWKFGPNGGHKDPGSRKSTLADTEALIKGLHFDDLNRAAFPGRLHRVSRTMSSGKASQVNLRIGRVASGPGWVFADLLKDDRSIVFAAPPARGKTTLLRDICRLLHDLGHQRKLVLIDRSDELGGSSDDPHACLGKKMRNPEVLIVDEIGTKVEAEALRAANQAGVTVIATYHGDLPHFVRNKLLSDFAGRVNVSTLGDEMAGNSPNFRKVKEEREEPLVIDTLVEVEAINRWANYHNLESVIDTLLADGQKLVEIRRITADGEPLSLGWKAATLASRAG
ncbi:hypothetical protein HDU86_008119 [Geranomyces michiganensis]|nr:hypothetical protein HDU86_008119 [Geranomyces michiganensis]